MKKKNKTGKKLLIFVLIASVLLSVTAVTVKYADSETKTIDSAFSVGSIDVETGSFQKDDTAICTKEAFECGGLTVKRDFDSTHKYQIFWYNIDKLYIGSTDVLNENFGENNIPEIAAFARIAIYPSSVNKQGEEIEDFSVNLFDVPSIAKKFTIKVLKDQTKHCPDLIEEAKMYCNLSAAQAKAKAEGKSLTIRHLRASVNGVENVSYIPNYSFTASSGSAMLSASAARVTPTSSRDLYMFENDKNVYKYAIKYEGGVNVQAVRVSAYGKSGDMHAPAFYKEYPLNGGGVIEFSIPESSGYFVVELIKYRTTENTNTPVTISMYKYLPNTEFCKNLYVE